MDRLKRHKGRFITEKKFNKRISFIELMRKKREEKKLMLESGATEPNRIVEGRRIIDFEVMTRFLNCVKCKEILSLGDIVKEARFGLASVFHVQCRKCDLINFVPSSKHDGSGRSDGRTYDVNVSAVQGTVNAGLDLQTVKKFLTIMNIPGGTSKAFRLDKELHGPETKEAAEGKKRVELEEKIRQEAQPNKVPQKRKRRSKNKEITESTAENNDNNVTKITTTAQNCANECSYQEYREDFNNAYVTFENSFNN